ncbi:MAG: translation initiation factor IF-2 N-terminal domain-containing protein, partial [Candidatus Poribacteria bacterium]|nr:translation initiation factor IF-2 N-terminal domain-containing protein [Candidatus Poribacteria bacterium]
MSKEPRQRRRAAKGNREEKKDQGTPVYELAKQYDITTKELVALLAEHGVRVKDDTSTLDADTVALIESEIVESVETVSTPQGSAEDTTEPLSNTTNDLQIEEGATVADLAVALELQPSALIMQLMKLKVMANINQRLDYNTLLML